MKPFDWHMYPLQHETYERMRHDAQAGRYRVIPAGISRGALTDLSVWNTVRDLLNNNPAGDPGPNTRTIKIMLPPNNDNQIDREVNEERTRARRKFPSPNGLLTALMEEVGEVANAILDKPWSEVRKEAIQVASTALRLALEGDPAQATVRKERGRAQDMPGTMLAKVAVFATSVSPMVPHLRPSYVAVVVNHLVNGGADRNVFRWFTGPGIAYRMRWEKSKVSWPDFVHAKGVDRLSSTRLSDHQRRELEARLKAEGYGTIEYVPDNEYVADEIGTLDANLDVNLLDKPGSFAGTMIRLPDSDGSRTGRPLNLYLMRDTRPNHSFSALYLVAMDEVARGYGIHNDNHRPTFVLSTYESGRKSWLWGERPMTEIAKLEPAPLSAFDKDTYKDLLDKIRASTYADLQNRPIYINAGTTHPSISAAVRDRIVTRAPNIDPFTLTEDNRPARIALREAACGKALAILFWDAAYPETTKHGGIAKHRVAFWTTKPQSYGVTSWEQDSVTWTQAMNETNHRQAGWLTMGQFEGLQSELAKIGIDRFKFEDNDPLPHKTTPAIINGG